MEVIIFFILQILVMITFASINCNGLRSTSKIKNVFNSSEFADVIALQETHWDDDFIERIKHIIDGHVYYSNCPNGFKGVAFVVRRNAHNRVKSVACDNVGRFIKMTLSMEDTELDIINVYAPNVVSERVRFFNELAGNITETPVMVMGDFNTVLSKLDRSSKVLESDTSRAALNKAAQLFQLEDVWRNRHPDTTGYSWRRRVEGCLRQSRIDYCLMSRLLLRHCNSTYYRRTSFSDHSIMYIKCDFSEVERGPGLYIFNNALLKDDTFCDGILRIIDNCFTCPLFVNDICVWWDNLKYKMKMFSQQYGKKLQKEKYRKINEIQTKLDHEYRRAGLITNYNLDTIADLELQLAEFEEQKCQGAALRAKAQYIHESDKCTKYFLNLEKCRQEDKLIKCLETGSGQVTATKDILHEAFNFYSDLYKNDDIDNDALSAMLGNIECFLNEADSELCDSPVTLDEIKYALFGMSLSKSPGNDSLTVEFYKHFWDHLGPLLIEVYEDIFRAGNLTRVMKSGVITLIYKQRGDKTLLKNWRPISLLNVDYKIISRCFANRLKKVIGSVINSCQTCCIPGRDIADTICSLRDAMCYAERENIESYFLKLDQMKAFDRVSHDFLFATLERFGFGEYFRKWIKIFYKDIRSAVKCNGHISKYFNVNKSVRQGCPISAMLYVLSVEPLGALIRKARNVNGLAIPGSPERCLLFQHADDTTICVTDRSSLSNVLQLVNSYGSVSNSKLNVEKSEVLCIGSDTRDTSIDSVPVVKDCMKVLGVYLGPNNVTCNRKNWKDKFKSIQTLINSWRQRKLSIHGRATVIKALLMSKLWYCMFVLPVDMDVIHNIKALCMDFLWMSKSHLVASESIIDCAKNGGLNVPDILHKLYAFRLKFLGRFFNPVHSSVWKEFFRYFLRSWKNLNMYIPLFFTHCHNNILLGLPPFYVEMLSAWSLFQKCVNVNVINDQQILYQPVFCNPRFCSLGLSHTVNMFLAAELFCLKDFLYIVIPGFLPVKAIREMVLSKYPETPVKEIDRVYQLVVSSIPIHWLEKLSCSVLPDENNCELSFIVADKEVCLCDLTTRSLYGILRERLIKKPAGSVFWQNVLNLDINVFWSHLFIPGKCPESIQLDWKILHNCIFTGEKLFRCGIRDTDACVKCNTMVENVLHLFVFCPTNAEFLKYIWELLEVMFQYVSPAVLNDLNFNHLILFGLPYRSRRINCNFVNIICSLARLTMYKVRNLQLLGVRSASCKALFRSMLSSNIRASGMHWKRNRVRFNRVYVYKNPFVKVVLEDIVIDLPP